MAQMRPIGAGGGDDGPHLLLVRVREGGFIVSEQVFEARYCVGACEEHVARRRGRGLFSLSRIRIADDDMGIGAAETEGIDAGEPCPLALQKLDRVGGHADIEAIEVDLLVRCLEMQRGRQVVVLEGQNRLHHPEQAGGRLGVADIRLYRADRHRSPALGADHRTDGPYLRRVPHLGAGTMALHEGDLIGVDAVAFVDHLQKIGLRLAGGQRNAVCAAGRIDARGNDPCVAAVTFALRPVGAAQNENDAAFGAHIAGAVVVIGAAESFGREHARLSEADEG